MTSRYLILSDIHANLEALEAVLEFCQGQFSHILVLGDLVDYGPNPNEVVRLLMSYDATCIVGNHDAAVLGDYDLSEFRSEWHPVVRWTTSQINETSRLFLKSLPQTMVIEEAFFVHANITDPLRGYILSTAHAQDQLQRSKYPIVFFGHTHLCRVYQKDPKGRVSAFTPEHLEELILDPKHQFLINPGSVGQPRNGDPRSFACIWEPQKKRVQFLRIPYNIAETQRKIRLARLPEVLAQRLQEGL